jgi:hypothetical protein
MEMTTHEEEAWLIGKAGFCTTLTVNLSAQ